MFESNAQIYRGKIAPLNYVAWRCRFREKKHKKKEDGKRYLCLQFAAPN